MGCICSCFGSNDQGENDQESDNIFHALIARCRKKSSQHGTPADVEAGNRVTALNNTMQSRTATTPSSVLVIPDFQQQQQQQGREATVQERVTTQGKSKKHEVRNTKKTEEARVSCNIYASVDEDDVCPTCFYEYDLENPRIVTKCNHHYHLSCIYEWMKRSDKCPVCDKVMIFEEVKQ